MDLATGHIVERYKIVSVLGHGGMAVVYKVQHQKLMTFHALKVLNIAGAELGERLLREGQVQAALIHPNVVSVTDVLEVSGAPALLMEWVDGPNLEEWLRERSLSIEQAESVFDGILAAVESAHALGVVHRDLKPGNVLMASSGTGFVPKVTDFGLAKALFSRPEAQQTRSGVPMGTPAYMSPEQVRDAKNVDIRTDIFSLGCILYELVCGRRAFVGKDTLDVFNKVAAGEYEAPSVLGQDLPQRISDAIQGALTVDPSRRIPNCKTLGAVLKGTRGWDVAEVDVAPLTLDWALKSQGGPETVDPQDEPTDPGPTSRDSIAPVREVEASPRKRRPFLAIGVLFLCLGAGALAWQLAPGGDEVPLDENTDVPLRPAIKPEVTAPVPDADFQPTRDRAAEPVAPEPVPEPVLEAGAEEVIPEVGEDQVAEAVNSTVEVGEIDTGADGVLSIGHLTESLGELGSLFAEPQVPQEEARAPTSTAPAVKKKSLEKQLKTQARQWRSRGFAMPDTNLEGTMSQGQMNQTHLFTDKGTNYLLIGACGDGCTDLDLEVLDERGNVVGQDKGASALPAVVVPGGDWTTYTIRASMGQCAVESCSYRVDSLSDATF